jgi:peptide/nickel transport system substrate-binding protein
MVYSWLRKPQFMVFIPLVLLLVLALACGDDPTPTPRPTAIPVSATAVPPTAIPAPTAVPTVGLPVPKYGGVIKMDRGGPPASLDPHRGANIEAGSAIAPILNGVLSFDALNPTEIIGDLAKDWVVSDDGLEWTFTINENIKWQDGVDLTADDIAFNVMRMIDPDAPRPKIFALQRWIDRAEVIDPLTVKVINKKPGLTWLSFFALPYSGIMPKHLLETGVDFDVFENVVGSGPFKGLDSVEGVSFEFEVNLTYWKEGLPYLDGIKAFAIGSAGTLIAAFQTGRIDMCTWVCINIKMDDVVRLKADEAFSEKHDILIMEGLSGTGIAMNTEIAPFDDVRVRRALFLAAHRQPIAETMGRGFFPIGYISDPSSQWSLPMDEILSTPGYRELDGKNHPDDIAEAKALLKAAGYENGFKGSVVGPIAVDIPDYIQLYVQQLKETLGIDLEPKPVPVPDWIVPAQKGDFFMTFQGYSPTILDPDDRFLSLYSDHAQNWSAAIADPRLPDLFVQQSAEGDVEKRKEIVFEMQRLVLGGGPGRIEFYWLVLAQIVNKKIMTEAGQYVLPFRANAGPYRHEHEWLEPE